MIVCMAFHIALKVVHRIHIRALFYVGLLTLTLYSDTARYAVYCFPFFIPPGMHAQVKDVHSEFLSCLGLLRLL